MGMHAVYRNGLSWSYIMSKSIEVLQSKWHEIVYTYEKEASQAWREVDVYSTDREGEAQYLQNLINAAEYYIENK